VPVSLPHTPYAIPTYYLIATAEALRTWRADGVRYSLPSARREDVVRNAPRSRDEGFEPK
jgi:aspartyl-tRNA(Asn)/glutamyl-tRNA(Gln) amidotransferase subunit A